MKEYFFKRALPFMLTFAVGAAVVGIFQLFGVCCGSGSGSWRNSYRGVFRSRRDCAEKFRRYAHAPASESRPLLILFKPDAYLPGELAVGTSPVGMSSTRVRVTFGEDGKVRDAETLHRWSSEVSAAAERAARHIRFTPALVGGVPTTVTEEVEIRFAFR
jgi:hypothetical protein